MAMFLNRGNQEFKRVLNSEIYVDKTDMLLFMNRIINTEQSYVCVSRPRRFGKSITANMIGAYYDISCDSAELFKDRKLGQEPGWDKYLNSFDNIRIDLAGIRASRKDGNEALDYIESSIVSELKEEYPQYDYCEGDGMADILTKLNEKTGKRFIIIIDEWDCLFRDDKNDTKVQNRYINLLRSLFKDNRAKNFLALAYITGILPIKKYNSESALNNFYEYTMINPYKLSRYIGFLEEEVIELCEKYEMDYKEARDWYDGYSFPGIEHIYGPNSIVKAMFNQWYDNYWSQTIAYNSLATYITMNFDGLKDAVKLMLGDQRLRVKVGQYQNDMVSFNSKDDVLTVLIHLGYLAYDSIKEEVYIPNKEVRQCFEKTLNYTGWQELIDQIDNSETLLHATIEGDGEEVSKSIEKCHMENTSILNYNNENALAACIVLAYYTARKDYIIIRELPTGRGFADMVFIPKPGVDAPAMVIELKWKKDANTALKQIKEKQYTKALEGYTGEILLVGISYEKEGSDSHKHTCLIESLEV